MIVKNEGTIIERSIRSCQPVLDAICITDTGSRKEDRTKDISTALGEEFKLPVAVLDDPWENFGHNRTHSVLNAKVFLSKLGWDLERTYLLLLDADMLLEIENFDKSSLTHDGYRVFQRGSSLVYSNVRLIRADRPWKCIGPTHEYWSLDNCNVSDLDTLTIDDRGDGGSKDDKFERDISLLTKGLEQEPDNERYIFYLAESYRNSKQYRSAIEWYRKRIERGGWREETWYARYMIGACHEGLEELLEATIAYLDAYADRPTRAEPLHDLARMWGINGNPRLGYFFAKRAGEIPYPQGDVLFINHKVYKFPVGWELSVCAFYMNKPEEFREGMRFPRRCSSLPHSALAPSATSPAPLPGVRSSFVGMDDDWYAHNRISYQVAPLLEGKADVTGLDRGLLFSLPSRQFWAYTADLHSRMFAQSIVGGTVAFWERLWEQGARFPDASLAEDAAFLQALARRSARLARLTNAGTFIYVPHDHNSWRFTPGQFLDSSGWQRIEPPLFMPESDCAFYGLMVASPTGRGPR